MKKKNKEKNGGIKSYLEGLKERGKKSRITKPYQMTGLYLAKLLEDEKHKSLYIRLAKEYNANFLVGLAKEVNEKKNIKNKGAYFMRLFQKRKEEQSRL